MDFINIKINADIATVIINKPKVNALNENLVKDLKFALLSLENDSTVKGVILSGEGKFFSFGFDVPEILMYSKERFTDFLQQFCELYTFLFIYRKPVVAAINGHAIAGGCMLSLSCDRRIMVSGNSKIGLSEITFSSTLLAGSTEMLRFLVGSRKATNILYSGSLYSTEEAFHLGLIDEMVSQEQLMEKANKFIFQIINTDLKAFFSIKDLLRSPIVEEMKRREKSSIDNFVEIWYSEQTRSELRKITIY
jgi:Delta3-Delta2-enoyl-CoA isomerase